MAKTIVIDEQRCLGCKQCVIECAMAHCRAGTLVEALSLASPPQPRVHVEAVGDRALPLHCQHCQDAPCAAVCPSGAIDRLDEDGPVLIDAERCIGCKFCLLICPFGVIELSRDGQAMVKCDQCFERTAEGQDPACVAACPTGAVQFVELDEHARRRRRDAARRLAASSPDADDKAEP